MRCAPAIVEPRMMGQSSVCGTTTGQTRSLKQGETTTMSRIRTAVKFFTYGLLVGVLFAPGSGAETRERIRAFIMREQTY